MTKKFFIFSLIFILLLISYWAVLLPYVYHDEFAFLNQGGGLSWHDYSVISAMRGRPGSSVLLTLYGIFFHSLDTILFIRFIAVCQLAIAAYLFLPFFDRFSGSREQSVVFSVMIMTLPSFVVLASWAGVSPFPMAMILSLIAAKVASTNRGPRSLLRHEIKKCILAGGLFFISNSIYPSTAVIYWVVAAIVWFDELDPKSLKPSRSARCLVVAGLLGYFMYWVCLKATHFVGGHILHNLSTTINAYYDPYQVSSDFAGKFLWFLKEPLFNALNFWNIFPGKIIPAVFCLIVGAAGVKFFLNQGFSKAIFKKAVFSATVGAVFCVLSFLPNLAATVDVASYRCLSGLVLLMSILGFISLRFLMPEWFFSNTLVFLMCIGIVSAMTTTYRYRALPSLVENRYLSEKIFHAFDNDITSFHFQTHAPYPHENRRYDEFGSVTLNFKDDLPRILTAYFRKHEPGIIFLGTKVVRTARGYADLYIDFKDRDTGRKKRQKIGFSFISKAPSRFDGVVLNLGEVADRAVRRWEK